MVLNCLIIYFFILALMRPEELTAFLRTKEGYKHTRPLLAELSNNQPNTIGLCIGSIKQILSFKTTTAEMKLYAIRFLKDCFEVGNREFIEKTEIEILPLLQQIALDSISQQKQAEYISDSSEQNILHLNNLFRFSLECIKNWKEVKTDQKENENTFNRVYRRLVDKQVPFPETSKYFKPNLLSTLDKSDAGDLNKSYRSYKSNRSNVSRNSNQSNASLHNNKIVLILNKIRALGSQGMGFQQQKQKIDKLSKEFDQVLEEYISTTSNFDENYINDCYSKLQIAIKEAKSKAVRNQSQGEIASPEFKRKDPVQLTYQPLKPVGKIPQQDSQHAYEPKSNLLVKTEKYPSFKKQSKSGASVANPNKSVEALRDIPQKFVFMDSNSSDEQDQNKELISKKNTPFHDDLSTIKQQPERNSRNENKVKTIDENQLPEEKLLNQLNRYKMYDNRDHFSVVNQINKGIYERTMEKKFFSQLPNKLGEGLKKEIRDNPPDKQLNKISSSNSKAIRIQEVSQSPNNRPAEPALNTPPQRRVTFSSSQPLRPKVITRLNMDYNSFTCAQNRLLSQNHKSEIKLFKQSILGKSMGFFQNSLIYIQKEAKSMEVRQKLVSSIKLIFHTGKIESIKTKVHNTRQTDIWVKPVSKVSQKQYEQEIAINLLSTPLNLIKLLVILDGAMVECFLPILFLNFLRVGQINPSKFNSIFATEAHRIVKSPILPLNIELISDPSGFKKYFSNYCVSANNSNKSVQLSFLYPEKELVLLCQVVFHPSQRAQFNCLELTDHKKRYSRELNDNLIFLFSN